MNVKDQQGKLRLTFRPEGIETSDSEDEDDYFDTEINIEANKEKNRNTKPRLSVSAEVYGFNNPKGAFVPTVIPKNEEVKAKIRVLFRNIFMFRSLLAENVEIIIDAMQEKKFKTNDFVIKQGDDGNELYVNLEGKLRCTKKSNETEEPMFLKNYIPGDVFGELCLLYNTPRAASIQALSDCVLFSLDRETFNHIVKDSSVQNRNKYEEFLSKVEVLQELDMYERNKLCDCLQIRNYEPNEYILREGDRGHTFFMIMKGQGQATKRIKGSDEEEVVLEYNENEYFGELSLLKNEPRAASVRTTVKFIRQP